MQVYLQYKYYITVTKTGGRHPIPRPWICFNEVQGGDVVMRMGTQQYSNQDSYVNEFVPPRTWTLLYSVWCITLKNLDTNYSFLYLLSLIMCERVGKNNC